MDLPVCTDVETLVVEGRHARDVHVAVALDWLGGHLGSKTAFAADVGYAELVAWPKAWRCRIESGWEQAAAST